ncbi:MAG TPA: putative sulfate exporter family transporter [Candidatus Acidoferrum sp.]|nr:putative sulfate exporter family transporter [Candidatus Acidoferrum sp.]
MNAISSANPKNARHRPEPAAAPGHFARVASLVVAAIGLILWASPPTALVAGILFALLIGHPFAHWNHHVTKWLLQVCVVLLGFGMNLPVVLRLGLNGSLFAAATICATLLLGWWVGRRLALDRKTTTLISVGTAICGGSTIAAVSTVIAASEAEIAVSIGTVFLLNAIALYVFPLAGHLLHLSQAQFGLWAGVAIHDISSVVGAGLSYGQDALQTATAVKLSRTLWIVPLTLAIAFGLGRRKPASAGVEGSRRAKKFKIAVPWFIGFFLLASLLRSYVPAVLEWSPEFSGIARRGMILVLFLIGTSLSLRALRVVGWRTVATGLVLWLFISVASLLAIRCLNLAS